MTIRQVKEDLWLLMAQKPSDPKPDSMLIGDFREHGRYIWLSSQLEGGEIIEADTIQEARKIRRAWMLYIPKQKRIDRECVIQTKGKTYRVFVRKV